MTDAEKIIKVLEYEAVPSEINCVHGEYIEAVGIYCRQKKQHAENCHDCEEHRMEYYGKKAKAILDIINRQKADNERLKKLLEEDEAKYKECAKRFYKEAIKEFAERLKEALPIECRTVVEGNDMEGITDTGFQKDDTMTTIDNLVKEMVGDAE